MAWQTLDTRKARERTFTMEQISSPNYRAGCSREEWYVTLACGWEGKGVLALRGRITRGHAKHSADTETGIDETWCMHYAASVAGF